jgi:hypothetical protein
MTTSYLTAKTTALCVLLVGAAALTYTPKAEASDFGFSIQLGRPRPVVREQVVVQTVRRWVPERHETRTEQVLVSPERHERQWVSEVVTITRRGNHGRETRTVTPGYWREVCIPAQYETRTSTVCIPGYWEETPVTTRQEVVEQPRGGIAIQIGHSDRRWDRNRR